MRPIPPAVVTSVTTGRPSVRVPVLSKATTFTPCRVWSASPRRNSTPSAAARPDPTTIEVGVASPMAQGQAMMSTATAAVRAAGREGPKTSQPRKVSVAATSAAGTNQRVT